MKVTVLGCGEAFDQELFNTSLLVEAAGGLLLFDCGYSIPPRVWQTVADADAIDVIWLSHPHADHFFGLPALLGRMWEEGRRKPLVMLGHAGAIEAAQTAMELGYRTLAARFEYAIDWRVAEVSGAAEWGGMRFRFAETRHSVMNYAVRLEAEGKTLCYSGDGIFLEDCRALYAGADLLVHEAFSFDESPVHGDIPGVLGVAAEVAVRRTALVHVQRRVRREQRQRIEQAIAGRATMPEPGTVFEL